MPAIQREFIWSTDQIICLFESIMDRLIIGSFLFWTTNDDTLQNFHFYHFIENYHKKDNRHNQRADVTGEKNLVAVLDGQQRLTALYIGLKGSYAEKIKHKRRNNPGAYPVKKLYLNLLDEGAKESSYEFAFLGQREMTDNASQKAYWFRVGDILNFDNKEDIKQYLIERNLFDNKFARQALQRLWEAVNEEKYIHYFLESSDDIERVLKLFIRVNSAGTDLTYSDMLLSVATAQWKGDAREEITQFVDSINDIKDGFDFKKDFVLKSAATLADLDVAFRVKNFNRENVEKIESEWSDIKYSVELAIRLIASFGYCEENLPSANAVIPIAYYLKKIGHPERFIDSGHFEEERKRIKKWFTLTLLKRVFSGQSDATLSSIRKILQESEETFPLEKIIEEFRGTNKGLEITGQELERILETKYGNALSFSILSLVYPYLDLRNNKFHKDHIFPKKFFKKGDLWKLRFSDEDVEFYMENYDKIANLQLLLGPVNNEKGGKDFQEWLEDYNSGDQKKKEQFKRDHLIPLDTDLSFENFRDFFGKRRKLVFEKIFSILN